MQFRCPNMGISSISVVWDPQESIDEVGDILNMQKPAGPPYSWYKKRGETQRHSIWRVPLRDHRLQPGLGSAECSL